MRHALATAVIAILGGCGVSIQGADDQDGGGGTTDPSGSSSSGSNLDGGGNPSNIDGGGDGDVPPSGGDAGADGDANTPLCICNAISTCESNKCVDVIGPATKFRVELPCVNSASGNYCETGAVTKTDAKTIQGTLGKTYKINIRVRGVVEQKDFTNATAGTAVGTGAALFAIGGTPDTGHWNDYTLTITDTSAAPATTKYRLNRGQSGHDYCDALDYTVTLTGVKAYSSFKLEAISVDPNSAENNDKNGNDIIIADIPPAPAAYNGQFVQVDVLSVAAE